MVVRFATFFPCSPTYIICTLRMGMMAILDVYPSKLEEYKDPCLQSHDFFLGLLVLEHEDHVLHFVCYLELHQVYVFFFKIFEENFDVWALHQFAFKGLYFHGNGMNISRSLLEERYSLLQ